MSLIYSYAVEDPLLSQPFRPTAGERNCQTEDEITATINLTYLRKTVQTDSEIYLQKFKKWVPGEDERKY